MYVLQDSICKTRPTAGVADHQLLGKLTGQPHLASKNNVPVMPRRFNEPCTTRYQISTARVRNLAPINDPRAIHHAPDVRGKLACRLTPTRAPHPAVTNNLPSLLIASNAQSPITHQITPTHAPHSAPVNNVPITKTCQTAPAKAPFNSADNPAPVSQQLPIVTVPPTSPRVKRMVVCKFCLTEHMTDKYTHLECKNSDCGARICLLNNCFWATKTPRYFSAHQSNKHFKGANPHQCYSCKSPKYREDKYVDTAACKVCGVNWCLMGNCTYETPFSKIVNHLSTKHN